MKRENVSLNLNDVLVECAEKELNQHALYNSQSAFDIRRIGHFVG